MTEQLLISAMLAVPFAGWLFGLVMPDRRAFATAISAALLCVSAVSWLVCSHAGIIESSVRLSAGEWLAISPENGLGVRLAFHANYSRCVLVLAASMILLLKIVGSTHSKGDIAARIALLYPLSVVTMLASDLVVLAIVWGVIDCCLIGLVSDKSGAARSGKKSLNTTIIAGCSGALLLVATLMAMARFGTSDIAEIVSRSAEDGRVDAATVAAGLTVLFAAAVAIRCALFPALIWPRSCLKSGSRDAGIVVVLAGILPGFALAVAVLPLAHVSSDAFLLLGTLGVLTCLTATGVALVQNDSARMVTLLSVSVAGLAASSLATCLPGCGRVATHTLLAQLSTIFVLHRCVNFRKRKIVCSVAIVVAVSGISGSNAILTLIELSLSQTMTTEASAEQVLLLIWWGILISQVLWGVAIVKLAMSNPASDLARDRDAPKRLPLQTSAVAFAVGAFVASLALLTCVVPVGVYQEVSPVIPARLFAFGAATPACLLGVVAAWLLAQAGESARASVVAKLDSLSRLCREWFYLEAAIQYGVALPVRGLAMLAEICDRMILGGTLEQRWEKVPTHIADSIEYLRFQPAVYYGLTGVLLVVGLLWSLA
jgi:formate hydrogenlyase subunit 3/multisubunit Na+/H+ antiporter MnhD subunit